MRCGDCQHWGRYDDTTGQCDRLTAYMEDGSSLSGDEEITPTRSYTGYDGYTITHEDFFCASFEERVDEKA